MAVRPALWMVVDLEEDELPLYVARNAQDRGLGWHIEAVGAVEYLPRERAKRQVPVRPDLPR